MRIIDTHSHIYVKNFDSDIDHVIDRAQEAGVEKILLPNIDVASIARLHRLSDKYPNYCLPMMGLHPTSVREGWENDLETVRKQFDTRHYIAVGEIGMDLYRDKTFENEQRHAFEIQLQWAVDRNLPVVIHSREAVKQSIESIRKIGLDKLKGVFHSFGGTLQDAKDIMELGSFMIGVNGTITYPKSDMPHILAEVGALDRIIVETDAPYLPPVPYRGKRNESAYTICIIDKLADIYGKSIDELGEITTENAKRLFNI